MFSTKVRSQDLELSLINGDQEDEKLGLNLIVLYFFLSCFLIILILQMLSNKSIYTYKKVPLFKPKVLKMSRDLHYRSTYTLWNLMVLCVSDSIKAVKKTKKIHVYI